MKRTLAYVAVLTGGLALSAPVLAQDDVTMQVFEGAFVTGPDDNVLTLPLSDEASPEGEAASEFGRGVARSATEDGRAFGEAVSGNARQLGNDMAETYRRDLAGETREIPERNLNLDIREVPGRP